MAWTLRDRVVAVVFVLAVAAMLAVPLARFFDDEPGRFGWHMFSLGRAIPEYTVVPASGDAYEINPSTYLAGLRSDFSLDGLPAHLCVVVPEAASIVVSDEGNETSVLCR